MKLMEPGGCNNFLAAVLLFYMERENLGARGQDVAGPVRRLDRLSSFVAVIQLRSPKRTYSNMGFFHNGKAV